MPSLTTEQKSCSNFVKYPSDCGRDWTKTKGRNLEIFWFNECLNCYLHWLENILLQPQNSTYKGRNIKFHSERYTLRRKSSFKLFFQCHGCSKKSVKGNFVLKNSRKIGKSIVLSPTKIGYLHPIRVIIKATSPKLLRSQGLDQLSLLRRSDQYLNV